MKSEEKRKTIFFGLLLLAAIAIGGTLLLMQGEPLPPKTLEEAVEDGCVLDYGESECLGGRIVIPFYNSGGKAVTHVRITLPVSSGQDIFEIFEPLAPGEGKSATLSECRKATGEKASLYWCCEECYGTDMNNPSEKVRVLGSKGS